MRVNRRANSSRTLLCWCERRSKRVHSPFAFRPQGTRIVYVAPDSSSINSDFCTRDEYSADRSIGKARIVRATACRAIRNSLQGDWSIQESTSLNYTSPLRFARNSAVSREFTRVFGDFASNDAGVEYLFISGDSSKVQKNAEA